MLSKVLTGIKSRMCLVTPSGYPAGPSLGSEPVPKPLPPSQPGLQSSSGCLGSDLDPRERGTQCSALLETGRVIPSPPTQDLPIADLSPPAL